MSMFLIALLLELGVGFGQLGSGHRRAREEETTMKILGTIVLATAVTALCYGAQAQTPTGGTGGTLASPNVTSTGPNANAPRPDSDANAKTAPTGAMSGGSGMSATPPNQMGSGAGFGTPNVNSTGPEANAPRVDSGAAARNSDSGKPPSPGSVSPR
jgi:hypothetical protein